MSIATLFLRELLQHSRRVLKLQNASTNLMAIHAEKRADDNSYIGIIMHRVSLIAATLVALVVSTSGEAQAQDRWRTVTAKDGSFSVELPGEPQYSATQSKTKGGATYTLHQYLLELGPKAFVVQIATYPTEVNVSNPKATKNLEGGKWSNIRWTTYQGATAHDANGMRGGNHIRNFSVLKGHTIFALTCAGEPGTALSADVNRFINSFLARK